MKRKRSIASAAATVLAVCAANAAPAAEQAANEANEARQPNQAAQVHAADPATRPAPRDSGASMVKPPEAASGAGGSSNPDNMPIKRPSKPTNDRMMHPPPASGANAK